MKRSCTWRNRLLSPLIYLAALILLIEDWLWDQGMRLVALMAITSGHPFSGVFVIIVAKIGGAAVVARLYALTRPTLLTLAWFARWHGWFMRHKQTWIGRLKASDAYRRASALAALLRRAARDAFARLHPRGDATARRNRRPARRLRRFIALWRARRH